MPQRSGFRSPPPRSASVPAGLTPTQSNPGTPFALRYAVGFGGTANQRQLAAQPGARKLHTIQPGKSSSNHETHERTRKTGGSSPSAAHPAGEHLLLQPRQPFVRSFRVFRVFRGFVPRCIQPECQSGWRQASCLTRRAASVPPGNAPEQLPPRKESLTAESRKFFPPGWEAWLHGRQGGPPPHRRPASERPFRFRSSG